jgi:hypothetical protein
MDRWDISMYLRRYHDKTDRKERNCWKEIEEYEDAV